MKRLDAGECQVRWQCFQNGESIAGSLLPEAITEVIANLPQAIQSNDCRMVVLLPGQDVLISKAPVSSQHVKNLPKAFAYAIEDQLAEPVEDVHVAIGKPMQGDNGPRNVAIVHDAWMRRLMQILAVAGLRPDVVTSEALLLPDNSEAHVVFDTNRVLFRLPDAIASSLELEIFLAFLDQYLATHTASPVRTLRLWTTDGIPTPPAFLNSLQEHCRKHHVALTLQSMQSSAFEELCRRWAVIPDAMDVINLLQGPYQPKAGILAFLPTGRVLAVIVAVWFAAEIALYLGASVYLGYRAHQFHRQSEAMYRHLFPEDIRIVDLRAQMQQHLDNSGAEKQTGFLPLIAALAQNIGPDLHIDAMHYDALKSELTADVTADNAAAFDTLKSKEAGVDVAAGQAVQEEKSVRTTLHVRTHQEQKP